AANTISSADEIVRAPLGMLWFRDSDFEVPSRHGRGVGPLSKDGRLFVQGTHGIRAYDAYNGHVIWEYYVEDLQKDYDQEHLIGVASTHGNWCIEGDRLYVRVSRQMGSDTFRNVLVLDTESGVLVDHFRVPALPDGRQGYWGYIAVENGILFGTVVNDQHITKWGHGESDMSNLFGESRAIFAIDAMNGELQWMYEAKHSIRHNAIAIGNGRVYTIDRPIYRGDYLFSGGGRGRGVHKKDIDHPGGRLLALDAQTGNILASHSQNIDGTLLALAKEENILVMTHQYTRFKLPSDVGGRMTGFDATSLKRLWECETGIGAGSDYRYSSRPIINAGTIYFEPHAYDVKTGNKNDFAMNRTYNCGIISSARHLMLFRTGTMGYLDLDNPDKGTQDYGGIRPGCWINTIPANGIVLMPDATARCNCSYLIKATIALKPVSM
ncbi:MAG: outer membrane protein assembly factor BamB family protein, partial [Planctomycetota bacterium]